MTLALWIYNLLAYSLQMAILAAAGTLMVYLFRLRVPRISLIYWQGLLLACLLLPVLQKWEHPTIIQTVVQTSSIVEPTEIIAATPTVTTDPIPIKIPVTQIIILILAAGAVLRMLWLGLGLIRLRLYLRRSEPVSEELPDTGRVSSRIGVKARFFISDQIKSPATFGIFTPTVLLPRSFPEMSEECREAVVCHELLHVRRRDWAAVLFEELVRALFWFHPAIWWLLSRIHLAREQAVDMEAVKLMGDEKPYLDSLLEIARIHGRPKAFPATFFLRERHLVQRVALLAKEVSMNRSRLTLSLAGIAFLLSGTVLMASGWFPLTGPAIVVLEENLTVETEPQSLDDPAVPADPGPAQTEPASTTSKHSVPVGLNDAMMLIRNPAAWEPSPERIGVNVLRSNLVHRVDPEYPEPARRARVQDTVLLRLAVDEKGNVTNAEVLSGHPLLRDAAVDAVKQWKYEPALLNDKPVPVIATVAVHFALPENPTDPPRPPLEISAGELKSKLIHKVNPEYPEAARNAHLQNTVVFSVTVNESGSVSNIETLRGSSLFIASAVEAVRQWKYAPTLITGVPVPVTGEVTVRFVLKDDSPSIDLVDPDNNRLDHDYVLVKFDDEGEIYISGTKTSTDDFESILRGKLGDGNTLFIQADPDIPFSRITDLIDRIKAVGKKQITIGGIPKGNPE